MCDEQEQSILGVFFYGVGTGPFGLGVKAFVRLIEDKNIRIGGKGAAYCDARVCNVKDALSMCKKLENIADSILLQIKNNVDKELQATHVGKIAEDINDIAGCFADGNAEKAANHMPDFLLYWANKLEEYFPKMVEVTDHSAIMWENALYLIIENYGTGNKQIDEIIEKYYNKIKKYDKNYELSESQLTYHTSNSPNKISVTVLKVGHETYQSLPLAGVPVKVFANGPDEVGHIGTQFRLKNIAGQTLKYVTVYLTPYNSVGDPVNCTVKGHSTYGINITGPISVGQKWEGYASDMWYNNTIVSAKIDHVDVTYNDDKIERYTVSELSNENSSTGCYVATSVYGSYDCPQVWTLRRYRDYTLAETWYGRVFIRTYYAISPTLVKWFGKTKWFKKMWQGKLDRMVAKLNSKGI